MLRYGKDQLHFLIFCITLLKLNKRIAYLAITQNEHWSDSIK